MTQGILSHWCALIADMQTYNELCTLANTQYSNLFM